MPTPSSRLDELKHQLAQLDALTAQGVLTGDAARAARDKLEAAVVEAVLAGGTDAGAPATATEPTAAAATAATAATATATAPALRRPSPALVGGLLVFVVAFGVLGYAWRGNREGLAVGPGQDVEASADDGQGGAPPHAVDDKQIEAMVAKLAAHLKDKPDDADGWAMLGRSYTALKRYTEAVAPFKRVAELRPRDAQALADLADALAVTNNRSLDGEPERLIMQAVQLDPKNLKALSLAGTVAFNHADFPGAAGYWQKASDLSEPGSELARELQGAVAEARQRAGLPPLAAAATPPAAASPGTPPAAQASAGVVTGRVSLAPALKDKVAPGDTVFVFARPVSGSKMPLAILRKQVSDLPLDFRLDDSLAMSPAATLSSVQQVVVGARISKSGNAMPQPGDLQVLSAAVPVGGGPLRLEIADTVR